MVFSVVSTVEAVVHKLIVLQSLAQIRIKHLFPSALIGGSPEHLTSMVKCWHNHFKALADSFRASWKIYNKSLLSYSRPCT